MAENQNNQKNDEGGKKKKPQPPKRIELALGTDIKINYQANQYEIPFAVYTKATDSKPEGGIAFYLQDENLQALTTNLDALQTDATSVAQGIIIIPCDSNVGRTVRVTARRSDTLTESSAQISSPLPVLSGQSWLERAKARRQNSKTKKTILWHAATRFIVCMLIVAATLLFGSAIKIGVLLLCAGLILTGLSSNNKWTMAGAIIAGISLWRPDILDNAIIYAAMIGAIIIPLSFSFEELVAKKQKIEKDGDIVDEHMFNPHPKVIATISLLAVTFYGLCLLKTIVFGHELNPQENAIIDISSLSDSSKTDVIAEIINEPKEQPTMTRLYNSVKNTTPKFFTTICIIWTMFYLIVTLPFNIAPVMSTVDGCLQGISQYLLLFLLIITLETPQELVSFWKGDQIAKQGERGSGKVEGEKLTLQSVLSFKELFDVFHFIWKWLKRSWK
ncbi:hypothetical protein COU00_00855 [Candidatus Falkowbacteria bacterium CG10_big_fil_rev_8_21_14_0_10_43_11]|uniref:Uncharacterized protein n=1 Tax=Candidatus Falkowbacteria bacterium CG10_big_fil_rev_8_21_14_0_10_43_11 TaxID=1974568 RepID=A0A2M6WMS0_9BACT|nr:MAG: hypothetical protein COU00_00855 [Candidatus Falkowbacteria bacterium CG10_big_fil_rev_8_21_14_0_10_43_11]